MSILNRLFGALGQPGALISDEARAFITSMAQSEIWVLAVGLRGTPAIPTIADASALDAVAEHRIDVTALGDDDSVFPFNYEEGGRQMLPFFTSEERARQFAASGSPSIDLSVFQPCALMAGFVAAPENEVFDLVLDPRSTHERRFSNEERLLLRKLSTEK